MSTMLRFDQVTLSYGERTAVRDASLALSEGEALFILGSSGCGKTSLVRLALGLVAPSAGCVWLNGMQVSTTGCIVVPPERRGLSVVFQGLALWPHLSVEAHLRFVLTAGGVDKRDQIPRIEAMLGRVGLFERRGAYPAALSGGERQRLAIARALVIDPKLVLLDEPLSNLDLALKRELLAVFRDLLAERQTTLLYVTHDVREAAYLGGRIAIMDRGAIAAEGCLDELRSSPLSLVRDHLEGLSWTGQEVQPSR